MKTKSPFTPKERLALYKKALSDYRKPGNDMERYCGFCWYFVEVHRVELYFTIETVFPELWEASLPTRNNEHTWWPDGVKAPRIRCLKKAIEILKQTKS